MPDPKLSYETVFSDPRAERRKRRADRTRAQALSPLRIAMLLLSLPVIMISVSLSVYMRTSPYEPALAALHLVALAGCDAAEAVGIAPAYRGGPGYHPRNDPDGDGIACGSAMPVSPSPVQAPHEPQSTSYCWQRKIRAPLSRDHAVGAVAQLRKSSTASAAPVRSIVCA